MATNDPKDSPERTLTEALRRLADRLSASTGNQGRRPSRAMRHEIESLSSRLGELAAELDPIRRPGSTFDTSNPQIIGRMIAITLAAQERRRMDSLEPFYGSGVYAIYYQGSFTTYAGIRNTEHPIYVGKADPQTSQARTPISQGTKLYDRLREHARNIDRVRNIDLADFECRFLVVISGQQKAAEDYLIRLFKPIWNSEIAICFGIGKHGDAAETRQNLRSPWDTMHPGRPWAEATTQDQKSRSKIRAEIAAHLAAHPPYATAQELFSRFMEDMRQLPSPPPSPPGLVAAEPTPDAPQAESYGEH